MVHCSFISFSILVRQGCSRSCIIFKGYIKKELKDVSEMIDVLRSADDTAVLAEIDEKVTSHHKQHKFCALST